MAPRIILDTTLSTLLMYHVASLCSGVLVVEYLATQTGGATVNNMLKLNSIYTVEPQFSMLRVYAV